MKESKIKKVPTYDFFKKVWHKKPGFKKVYQPQIRIKSLIFSQWTFRKFLVRYKKIKRKLFWIRRFWMDHIYIFRLMRKFFWREARKFKFRFRGILIYSRWSFFYHSFKKLWKNLKMTARIWSQYKVRWALFPRFMDKRIFRGTTDWYYPNTFDLWKNLIKNRWWTKRRKRWIWHRMIYYVSRPRFMSNLKKWFTYNIVIRKYFKKILPYELYKKKGHYQAPYFLVQNRLVPVVKRAFELCRWRRVIVNGYPISETQFIQPFDIISFNFRKMLFWFKLKRYRYRKKSGSKWKMLNGLIYNRKIRHFIYYRNVTFLHHNTRNRYQYYYYFYRNLLQRCRLR
jgi:hypothetical protein